VTDQQIIADIAFEPAIAPVPAPAVKQGPYYML